MATLRLGWHFDFHSHPACRIGEKPDPEGVAAACADAGLEMVNTFAKCHSGFSYYPTDVGNRHPKLVGDPFGDILRACRAKGVKVAAYVSFGIDGAAARKNPSWEQTFTPGLSAVGKRIFVCVCPFTPYLDELMLPQIDEIVERYRPDGFWFDTMSAMRPCYCDSCRRAFREATGREIPVEEGDAGWGEYGAFRHERSYRMLARVGGHVAALAPEIDVAFNQVGSLGYPEPLPEGVHRISLDFPTYGHQSRCAALHASYGQSVPPLADVMPTRFKQGWGDWSPSHPAMLEQVAAAAWANRGGLYMGCRLHPQNRLSHGTRPAMEKLAEVRDGLAEAMPPDGAERLPDVLLLHGTGLVYGEDMSGFARDPRIRLHPLEGMHHLLLDAGCNTLVSAEYALEDWLHPSRLLVIPQAPCLAPETDAAIRGFLAQGGRVLAVGTVPKVRGRPAEWIGAELEGRPWLDHAYLPPFGDEDPVLVRGDCHRVRLLDAEAAAFAIAPYDVRHGQRMGWGIAPPDDAPSDSPILTRRREGAGEAWFLACPMAECYAAHANFDQAQWLARLIGNLSPRPVARLDAPSGSVEVVAYGDAKATWCALVNHGGEQMATRGLKPWARQLGPLPPYKATLELTPPAARRPRLVTNSEGACAWREQGGKVLVPAVLAKAWDVVCVEWE